MNPENQPPSGEEGLRISAMGWALVIALRAATAGDETRARALAETSLSRVEHELANSLTPPECPEAWLAGMSDIASALREAIALLA